MPRNPIVNADFPDPCIVAVPGEGYYAYATHDVFSPTPNNVLVRHSADLIHWSEAAGALTTLPDWAQKNQQFWSPHVVCIAGEYRMYYAAHPDAGGGMALAMASSKTSTGFTDSGAPLNGMTGSSYEMIDPCLFVDPVSGKHLLYYGSAHQPISVVEMGENGITVLTEPIAVLQPIDEPFHRLLEGAFVTYKKEWNRYYLWVSGDNTWAAGGYALSVFYSDNPLGPFLPQPTNCIVLRPNTQWDCPGHNCVITNAAGTEWCYYHAVDTADRFIAGTDKFLRKMCRQEIVYDGEGWISLEEK